MSNAEDYNPNWSEEDQLPNGWYVWNIFIQAMEFKDIERGKDKPFMLLTALVENPPEGAPASNCGYKFIFRIYIHQKSRGWCCYFLKKFGYPPVLLASEQPTLRKKEIEGLHGKVLVKIDTNENTGLQNVDVKGFDQMDGTDLEEKKAKAEAKEKGEDYVPPETKEAQAEPAIDLNADVANQQAEESMDLLDSLPDDSPSVEAPQSDHYQATEDDLPESMR